MVVSLGFCENRKLMPVVEDKRPENETFGEFWKTRGVGNGNVSGFVVSKEAGERIDRMVKLVLESNETKSYLDYRYYEPNYVQYKFSGDEFDIEKLSDWSESNNGVVTLEMLRFCKK